MTQGVVVRLNHPSVRHPCGQKVQFRPPALDQPGKKIKLLVFVMNELNVRAAFGQESSHIVNE